MSEVQQSPPVAQYDDEIDFHKLFRVLWAGKWLIVSITTAAAVVAIVVALMLPNIYRAEALLAPNDRDRAGGLSALAAQYGGLASLAGINLASGPGDKTALGLKILESRKFVSEFIERRDILLPLMAVNGWNAETGNLVVDPNIYDTNAEKWIREVGPPKKTIPSIQEAYEEFMDILTVSQDKKSGFVIVAIEHYSPIVAKQWVDWLVEDINQRMMRQDVGEAEQAIEYLHRQIERTSLSDLQEVFFSLIEEQTKTVMLARVSSEYLLKTIDPAIASEQKAKPRRALIVLVSTFFSAILALLGVFAVGYRQ